jgi:hypothetical protein
LAATLKRFRGIAPWLDREEIAVGEHLHLRIPQGLTSETDCCICLISPNYMRPGSNSVRELNAASELHYAQGKPIYPILLGGSRPPYQLGDLVWSDFKNVITRSGDVDRFLFDKLVKVLVSSIRKHFSTDLTPATTFLDPHNSLPVLIMHNRSYKTPYRVKINSSTGVFLKETGDVFSRLRRRGSIGSWELKETDYLKKKDLIEFLDKEYNIITYASSKINPCTFRVLTALERQYAIRMRFVYQKDILAGKSSSAFTTTPDQDERLALLWNDDGPRFYGDGEDYGLIIRANPKPGDRRIWWVLAGAGRPGSIAARKLVFDTTWSDVLWSKVKDIKSFACLFKVRYRRSATDCPRDPSVLGCRTLSL